MKKLPVPIAVVVFLLVSMAYMASTPKVTVCEAPKVEFRELDGYTGEKLEISEAEINILPADTKLEKRLYKDARGQWFAVTAVIGGTSKSSIHRPELCLPAQGFRMINPKTIEAAGLSWRFITLDHGVGRAPTALAYTFYNQEGFHTSSHIRRILRDVWDRSVLNRIDRWVMITVNLSSPNEEEFRRLVSRLRAKGSF